MKNQSFADQLQISLLSQECSLFKIFGFEDFSFQKAFSQSKVDWSGFYTQLKPEHSMRYLTKKWDDGANEACLILLKPIKNIELIKINDKEFFSNPKISGDQKALRIKQILRKRSKLQEKFQNYCIQNEDILLKSLGERQTLLECIDVEQNQIIVPHQMLNKKYFFYKKLLTFKRSNDGLLRTMGWKWGDQYNQNLDWHCVKGQCQYEPYLLLKQDKQIKSLIDELNCNDSNKKQNI